MYIKISGKVHAQKKPWKGILVESYFSISYMYHIIKGKITGQLVIICDIILLIKHIADWKLNHHKKKTHINNYINNLN